MRLDTISLKGVLRYADPVRLDLRELPPGLIAVCGDNGGGKTSLLEAAPATLYREFPTRRTKPLVDYALAEDSYLEITFGLEGRGDYRARVNLDGPHRKTDAVLAFIQPDGRERILTDGKVTSYDAAIAALLPPLDLLLASVFAAQNRAGSFITIDRAERKQLFSTLLGLEHYEALSQRARAAAQLVQQALARFEISREALAREASDAVARELETLADRLHAEGATLEQRREQLQADLHAAHAELEALQTAAATHAAAQTRADVLEVELRAATAERARLQAAADELTTTTAAERAEMFAACTAAVKAIEALIGDTSALEAELTRITTSLQASRVELEARIAKNRELLSHADEIPKAIAAIKDAEATVAAARLNDGELRQRLDTARARERDLVDALRTIEQKEKDLARVTADTALLTSVPCGGAGPYAGCQFLTKAAAAKAQIPALQEACGERAAAERALTRVRAALEVLTASLTDVGRQITAAETAVAALRPIAANEPHVRLAQERIRTHETRLIELVDESLRQRGAAEATESRRVADLRTRLAEREQQYHTDLAALTRRADARELELRTRLDATQRAIDTQTGALATLRAQLDETAAAAERAGAQKALLSVRQREWDESTAALAKVESQSEDLARRRAALEQRRQELRETDVHIAALDRDQREWLLLARAFARDGLPMIEIDNAGPTVTAYTNDLLRTCYGSRFTVELMTQEAKVSKGKDGSTMKDAFELKVFDAVRGGEPRDLSDLSGGEQVLVDEALKSAIALLVNEKNQQRFRTCWRDETTGALDAENSARYIDMLRRVQQLGGFHHLFFVSHNTDEWAKADAQLMVGGGQVSVRSAAPTALAS